MNRWIQEDWRFEITVTQGEARHCRLGLEKGDKFECSYECPTGFCSKSMAQLYTLCEVIRCGGDFRLRGSKSPREIRFPCADGVIEFEIKAIPIPHEED